MDPIIVLAHDGSINADWLARYALQLASRLVRPELMIIHILDGTLSHEQITAKFSLLREEGCRRNIVCRPLIRSMAGDVFASLKTVVPCGDHVYCLCGARITPRGRGFLTGTVSERLLGAGWCNVLAIRVVSPGLLGCPSALLFPLAGHPRGFQSARPFLQLLLPAVRHLYLLRIMTVHPIVFPLLSKKNTKNKLSCGHEYLKRVCAEIRQQLTTPTHLDRHVVVSDDWAQEILIHAGKINASMILLGATERSLSHRLMHSNRVEQILQAAPCDVGIYRRR